MPQFSPPDFVRAINAPQNQGLRALVCREALALVNASEPGLFHERELNVPLKTLEGFPADVEGERGSVNALLFSSLTEPHEISAVPSVIPWEGQASPGSIITVGDDLRFVVHPAPAGVAIWISAI